MNEFEYEYKLLSNLIDQGDNYKDFLKYLYNSLYLKNLCSTYIIDLETYLTKEVDHRRYLSYMTYKFSLISELKRNKPLYHKCILSYIQSLEERDFVNLFKESP